jgi:Secretion system C-terminal sorting domain
MSKNTKRCALIMSALLAGAASFGQAKLMEMTLGHATTPVAGNGFGPRTSNHVVFFDKDRLDNGNFNAQGNSPDAITAPYISATISLANQQFTGLTYGAGTTNLSGSSNAVPNGLVFGAGPSQATGTAPGNPNVQQASPLNSYDLFGAFGNSWGPRNGMFMSDAGATPVAGSYPAQSGTGIDAEGLLPGAANDANGGVSVFTCAQVMADLGRTHNAATRHYYGDLVIAFSRFVQNPVIHIAGLGGSYRYCPTALDPSNTANWISTFFTTELELVGGYPMTRMAGNQFFDLSGNLIVNNNTATPNGESTDQGVPAPGQFNNYGAASGSVRINQTVRFLRFRVYLRGATGSQFNWSAPGSAVNGGTRDPLTGDIWFISASLKQEQLIPLPATGMQLNAALSGNDVQLNWKTASEINTKEFQIERSSDGVNFSVIGTKAAMGNSVVESSYAHTDLNMQAPVYYYRLRLLDEDGSYKFSNIAVVRKAGSIKGVRVFPNPAISNMSVEFSNVKGEYLISLYNMGGQEVSSQRAIVQYNVQYVNVNRNNLPAGTYIMKVRNTENGESFSQKVTLQ